MLLRDLLTRVGGGRQRGQASAWSVGAILLLVLVFGLVADGGLLFAYHRRAALLAESAARAGANVIDTAAARANPTAPPVLDTEQASAIAEAYVVRQEPDARVTASATADTVSVEVHLAVVTTLLHAPGQPAIDVMAQGQAHSFVGTAAVAAGSP
jgi:hypothetical protein